MNLALFYDTEATGLPLYREPSDDPRQPHLVQLAASLVDMDKRQVIQSIDLIVKPKGWVIPDEVTKIHGITTEYAMEVGFDEALVVGLFMDLWNGVRRIAHNEPFDARILRIAIKRCGFTFHAETWKHGESECTCAMATPVVKCPPTAKMKAKNMNFYKKANLTEAYRHFFNEDFEDAHTAIADVKACMSVYFAILDERELS